MDPTNYLTKLEFDEKNIIFIFRKKKINENHLYLADIKLNPFYANLAVNLNSLDFFDLIKKWFIYENNFIKSY